MKPIFTLASCFLLFAVACTSHAATLQVPAEYPSVQDAVIAAAPGDSVLIAAGTYEEQLWITHDITVAGAGIGLTVIACPETLGHTFDTDYQAVVFIENTPTMTLTDLTIDGADRATGTYRQCGVGLLDAGATITGCEIQNTRETVMTSAQTGLGVYAANISGQPRTITINNSSIAYYQKAGAVFRGAELTVDLDELTSDPVDTSPAVQNGIEILQGVSATLNGGAIAGNRNPDQELTETSVGLLVVDAVGVSITGVTLNGNQAGIYLHEVDSTLDACEITGWDDSLAGHGIVAGTITGRADPTLVIIDPLPSANPSDGDADRETWSELVMTGCTVTGHQILDTVGLVVAVTDMPDTVAIDVTECSFGQWDYGAQVWNSNSIVDSRFLLAHFLGNLTYGLFSDSPQPVDAVQSWWGDGSGPSVVGPGSGDGVSSDVLFDPWLHGPVGLSIQPASGSAVSCEGSTTLTVHYVPGVNADSLRGFELYIDASDILGFDSMDIIDSGVLAAIGDHHFEVFDEVDGSVSIADVLLGPTAGLETEADLFTVSFHGVTEGMAMVGIPQHTLRNLVNQDIPVTAVQSAEVEVDCTAPEAVTGIDASPGHQKSVLDWIDSPATDVVEYEIWRGMWYDTTPGVSAYPAYHNAPGFVIPARPADRAAAVESDEWVLAGTVLNGVQTFVDIGDTTRGVYRYEIFARDHVANYSLRASANSTATNYWLGDLTYDGYIGVDDMSFFGSTYGTDLGTPFYKQQANIGPTDGESSPTGVPYINERIGYDDLGIISANYGSVTPESKNSPVLIEDYALETVTLVLKQTDSGEWSLGLPTACPQLRGIVLSGVLPAGTTSAGSVGRIVPELSDPHFFYLGTPDRLDVTLFMLGRNAGFDLAGEVIRFSLRDVELADMTAEQIRVLLDMQLILCATNGRELEYSLITDDAVQLPSVCRLEQNAPNPFNPKTVIRFELPVRQDVKLEIFGVDGCLVTTLISDQCVAGRHAVQWDGQDRWGQPIASGVYFYRLQTETDTLVRKMILAR